MKLIVDIDKEDYEYIRENKGMHYTSTTKICEAIFDAAPLETVYSDIAKAIGEYCERHAIYDWGIIEFVENGGKE